MAIFLAANTSAQTISGQATIFKCATCGKVVNAQEHKSIRPFCSPRCKDVDLGRWFNEYYTLPADQRIENLDDTAV